MVVQERDLAGVNAQKNGHVISDSEEAVFDIGCFSCLSLGKRLASGKSDRAQMVTPPQTDPSRFPENRNEVSGPAQTRGICRSNIKSRSLFSTSGSRKRVRFLEEELPSSAVQILETNIDSASSADSVDATQIQKCPAKLHLLGSDVSTPHTSSTQEPANKISNSLRIPQASGCTQAVRDASLASPAQSPSSVEALVEHWAASLRSALFHDAPQEQGFTIRRDEDTVYF